MCFFLYFIIFPQQKIMFFAPHYYSIVSIYFQLAEM